MRGGIRLLDHGGVLLRALIHDVDGRVDLVKASRLLACGIDDRMDVGVDLLHFGDDGGEGFAGLVNERDPVLDLFAGGGDEGLDLFRRVRRALREFTHFLCNDCKALAGFARAGGLDACIERQQIGLEGDLVDHADDVGDRLR